jgi:hypothetical protein
MATLLLKGFQKIFKNLTFKNNDVCIVEHIVTWDVSIGFIIWDVT